MGLKRDVRLDMMFVAISGENESNKPISVGEIGKQRPLLKHSVVSVVGRFPNEIVVKSGDNFAQLLRDTGVNEYIGMVGSGSVSVVF